MTVDPISRIIARDFSSDYSVAIAVIIITTVKITEYEIVEHRRKLFVAL
jgi:hypothetical protein